MRVLDAFFAHAGSPWGVGAVTAALFVLALAVNRFAPNNRRSLRRVLYWWALYLGSALLITVVAALLWKELRVALMNGIVLGLLLGVIVWLWFRDPALSLVIASALTINLLSAASAGVVVPMTLKRLGFDPALAGGVILTTVTDVMGFLAFLGLGTVFLL